jgi:hypothetical protein
MISQVHTGQLPIFTFGAKKADILSQNFTSRWRIILRWIFRKWDVGAYTRLIWHRIGTVGGHL